MNDEKKNFVNFECKNCGSDNKVELKQDRNNNSISNLNHSPEINFKNKKIPDGLEDFLLKFTVEILKQMPLDLSEFGYEYFVKRSENTTIDDSQSLVNHLKKTMDSDNEEYDDIELEELKKFKSERQHPTRRGSVFSKTYDPDEPESTETEYPDQLTEEDLANRKHEAKLSTKNYEKNEILKRVLLSIVIFKHLDAENVQDIIDSMFERKSEQDEVIIREGEEGKYFYVITKGAFDVYKMSRNGLQSANGEPQSGECPYGNKVATLKDKGYFGELSLLYDQPRSATIVSKEDGILFCMNRDKFKRLAIGSSVKRHKINEDFVKSLVILQSMEEVERRQVADALITVSVAPGICIFKQNDEPNGMYFIESGNVSIKKFSEETNNYSPAKKLFPGEYFGEVALIKENGVRSASAYAADDNTLPVRLAFLDLEAFRRLIKDETIKIIKEKMKIYDDL